MGLVTQFQPKTSHLSKHNNGNDKESLPAQVDLFDSGANSSIAPPSFNKTDLYSTDRDRCEYLATTCFVNGYLNTENIKHLANNINFLVVMKYYNSYKTGIAYKTQLISDECFKLTESNVRQKLVDSKVAKEVIEAIFDDVTNQNYQALGRMHIGVHYNYRSQFVEDMYQSLQKLLVKVEENKKYYNNDFISANYIANFVRSHKWGKNPSTTVNKWLSDVLSSNISTPRLTAEASVSSINSNIVATNLPSVDADDSTYSSTHSVITTRNSAKLTENSSVLTGQVVQVNTMLSYLMTLPKDHSSFSPVYFTFRNELIKVNELITVNIRKEPFSSSDTLSATIEKLTNIYDLLRDKNELIYFSNSKLDNNTKLQDQMTHINLQIIELLDMDLSIAENKQNYSTKLQNIRNLVKAYIKLESETPETALSHTKLSPTLLNDATDSLSATTTSTVSPPPPPPPAPSAETLKPKLNPPLKINRNDTNRTKENQDVKRPTVIGVWSNALQELDTNPVYLKKKQQKIDTEEVLYKYQSTNDK